MNWIKHIITGADNQTVDVARVLWIVGVLYFLGCTGFEVFQSGHFNMTDFALSYSGLLAGGAAGVKIKESSEPSASQTPDAKMGQ